MTADEAGHCSTGLGQVLQNEKIGIERKPGETAAAAKARRDGVEPDGAGIWRQPQHARALALEAAGKAEAVAIARIGDGKQGRATARGGGRRLDPGRRGEGQRRGAAEGKKRAPVEPEP
jgi:hypothetical protein